MGLPTPRAGNEDEFATGEAVAQMAKQGRRHSSPGALQSIDGSLERQRKLFTWGHITEAEFQAKKAELLGRM